MSVREQSYRDWLISGIRTHYDLIERAYTRYDTRHETHRVATLQGCKTNAWFMRHRDSGIVRIASDSCKLRFCPLCEKAAKLTVTNQIIPHVKAIKTPRFLTLTLKHTTAPLADQLDFLLESWRRLRNRRFFKDRVTGGIWFIQATHPNDAWHPHLHAILDGRYLDHEKIKTAWAQITQTSTITDIRMVRHPEKVAAYVARYAQQMSDPRKLLPEHLDELLDATHNRHTKGAWGSLAHVKLSPQPPDDADEWENVGSWWRITRAFPHDTYAKAVVDAWWDHTPLERPPPEPPPAIEYRSTYSPWYEDWCGTGLLFPL